MSCPAIRAPWCASATPSVRRTSLDGLRGGVPRRKIQIGAKDPWRACVDKGFTLRVGRKVVSLPPKIGRRDAIGLNGEDINIAAGRASCSLRTLWSTLCTLLHAAMTSTYGHCQRHCDYFSPISW